MVILWHHLLEPLFLRVFHDVTINMVEAFIWGDLRFIRGIYFCQFRHSLGIKILYEYLRLSNSTNFEM